MTAVTILVGSMTGNAEFAAEDLQLALREDCGIEAKLLMMDKLTPAVFVPGGVFIICTSTYGEGEVPENAVPLYNALCEARPDLAGVRYAVFGLGDANYRDTYNFGGKRFDDILSGLGAQRLAERGRHDINGEEAAGDAARAWLAGWQDKLRG